MMVEYSQPNTHKAFHVGHMRNVALGGSIARIYRQLGFNVITANYYGDEGAHVSKCLWLLQRRLEERGVSLSEEDGAEEVERKVVAAFSLPGENRGEFLGGVYAEATDLLDLGYYTDYPIEGVVGAKVLSMRPHPENSAWNVVEVAYGPDQSATVVCAGNGYTVGDVVAYAPVGTTLQKKTGAFPVVAKVSARRGGRGGEVGA